MIKESQVQAALGEQRRHGGLIGQCLVTMGACGESDVATALAVQAGLEAVDLAHAAPEAEALEAVDGSAAHAYGVLPLRVEAGTLVVALADPMNSAVIEDLAFTTGLQVRAVVADA
ncbi:MAG: hypothetical protein VXZ39_01720, partial [Planctomycetota bacterium]|nr:hypothetical protein [Planctomycetota bacterium]